VNTCEQKETGFVKKRSRKSRCILKMYRNFKLNTVCNYTAP